MVDQLGTLGITESVGAVSRSEDSGLKRDGPVNEVRKLPNGDIDPDELMRQLEKENRDYIEQTQFISKQLSALKTQMHDLKKDEGLNGASHGTPNDNNLPISGDKLHVSLVRQTSHKHIAYNKV